MGFSNILDQSEPVSNGNEGETLYSPEFQNWSLTIRYSLAPYRLRCIQKYITENE